MFDFIKSIDEIIYSNFETLFNNITNHDKNINSSFRITAESLLNYINNNEYIINRGWNVKTTSYQNYGAFFTSEKFLNALDYFKIDPKIFRVLKGIQESGNDTIHNRIKIFDYNDAKEKFKYLILISVRIYETEKEDKLNINASKINKYFDELFDNQKQINIEEENINIDEFDLVECNKSLYNDFKEINSKENFYSFETIKNIYELLLKTIDYIKYKENINDTEKLIDCGYKIILNFYNYLLKVIESNGNLDYVDTIFCIEDYLYDINSILIARYNLNIFNWLEIKLNKETIDDEYIEENLNNYEKIAKEIESVEISKDLPFEDGRFYVVKKKPIIVNNNKYYEIELEKAVDNESKFDRKTLYTKLNIFSNYSIKISYVKKEYNLFGENTEILIINNYEVSIRPCELQNYIYIFNCKKEAVVSNSIFYKKLNSYIEETQDNLLEIILYKEEKYKKFKELIFDKTKISQEFVTSIDRSREIILNELDGANTLRYLLIKLKNFIIKNQHQKGKFAGMPNVDLSNLCLSSRCKPFERTPLSAYLVNHINNYNDVLQAIPSSHRSSELLAHKIDEICLEQQKLFVSLDEIKEYENIENLIMEYKNILSDYNLNRSLGLIDNYVYKTDEIVRMKRIMNFLRLYSNCGENNFKQLLNASKVLYDVDNEEKKQVLNNMFNNSRIAFLYGEAGSGKTKILTEYMCKIFKDYRIVYLANTHNAKENLKGRVSKFYKSFIPNNIKFYTIKQFLQKKENYSEEPQIYLIDEAKVISNGNIEKLLCDKDCGFEYMIFAGDVSQLDAIKLGNWFELSKKILNKKVLHELSTVFRSENEKLEELWRMVRNYDSNVIDYMEKNNYSKPITDDIFVPKDESEIILCLNYSGMYGINKINSYFQERNKNSIEYIWGMNKYKVGDPILFNDYATKKYDSVLYNNLKGVIKKIEYRNNNEMIAFTIKVEDEIKESDILPGMKIYWEYGNKDYTIITISAEKHTDKDVDVDNDDAVVPFDIAYALSIHKAQGLQYNSVKIVITPESEGLITNSVFYTAITRAQEKLTIYWTKAKQTQMLDILTKKDNNVDDIYLYKV